ncbi:G1 family endopeptidase [Luteipulveratus sp. YIM 133132]|uniref:G1 family glutamic endopeptidase n=1 Tax=Luteipulveratus flavus TaxID=3031728 RepID=UPI0023AE8CA2|nr:G1 family glutamic endopeptidase [Luteipulveratus sp. YIM 133132]MDE9365487.1 G1 family endopeptidase [Luteipulveratus sp. YIM 133132]
MADDDSAGPTGREVRRTVPLGRPGVLTFRTVPQARCELRRAGEGGRALQGFSDDEGVVSFVVHGEQRFAPTELTVTCTGADGTEVVPVVLQCDDVERSDMPELVGPERHRWENVDHDGRRRRAELDPHSMSAERLRELGYPPKPDPDSEPDQFAVWTMMADLPYLPRPDDGIEFDRRGAPPQLKTRIDPGAGPLARKIVGAFSRPSATSPNWSGAMMRHGAGTYDSVLGFWDVPQVSSDRQELTATCVWVGLDGYDSNDVVQAGTWAEIFPLLGGHIDSHFSWHEWFPDPARAVSMRTLPGDRFFATVWMTGGTANYLVVNRETGESSRGTDSLPSGAMFVGNNAEWVVERPSIDTSTQLPMAWFTPVPFEMMWATGPRFSGSRPTASMPSTDVIMYDGQLLAYPVMRGVDAMTVHCRLAR